MRYPKFKKGDTFESEKLFTREDVLDFARLTGDHNPIHTDEEYGRRSVHGRNIVHGNLVISSLSGITREGFPGPGTIVLRKNCLFIRPVYIGERYTLIIKVSSVNHDDNSAEIRYVLKNSAGRTCVSVKSTIKNEHTFRQGL